MAGAWERRRLVSGHTVIDVGELESDETQRLLVNDALQQVSFLLVKGDCAFRDNNGFFLSVESMRFGAV